MTKIRANGASSASSAGRASWDDVRARLALAARTVDDVLTPSAERVNDILQARARELARAEAAIDPEVPLEIAVFALGGETYAIETRYVHEIARAADLTKVPGTPDFVAGVTTLRGEIVMVIDLRRIIGLAVTPGSDAARVVVLGGARIELARFADAAHEVRLVAPRDLLDPPDTVRGVGRDYLRGITKDARIVLDGAAILADRRLYVDQGEES
jgi:purine-binding chemotaxis protein CheW